MIVITKIEAVNVPSDWYKMPFEAFGMFEEIGKPDEPKIMNREQVEEIVKGRCFIRPSDGTQVIVGYSMQAGDVLGMPFEAYDNIKKEVYELERKNKKLNLRFDKALALIGKQKRQIEKNEQFSQRTLLERIKDVFKR